VAGRNWDASPITFARLALAVWGVVKDEDWVLAANNRKQQVPTLWHFDKPEEHWIKSQEELGVIFYRERLQKRDFEKKSLTLDQKLGGVKLTAKEPAADLGRAPRGRKPGRRTAGQTGVRT